VKIIFLEPLWIWKKEMNNHEKNLMRRDKEVEEVLQEIKKIEKKNKRFPFEYSRRAT
jgi:hypothetical protein